MIKIRLSKDTRQHLKWYNIMIGTWIVAFFYTTSYVVTFGIEYLSTGFFYFRLSDIMTQAFIISGFITIIPVVYGMLMDVKHWIQRHYKDGILTL